MLAQVPSGFRHFSKGPATPHPTPHTLHSTLYALYLTPYSAKQRRGGAGPMKMPLDLIARAISTGAESTCSAVDKARVAGTVRVRRCQWDVAVVQNQWSPISQLFNGPNSFSFFFGGCPTKMVQAQKRVPFFFQGH